MARQRHLNTGCARLPSCPRQLPTAEQRVYDGATMSTCELAAPGAARLRRLAVLSAIALLPGCGGAVPAEKCKPMGGMGGLVGQAALIQLNVYGPEATCAGSQLAPGAG